jgi:hypothetical protein
MPMPNSNKKGGATRVPQGPSLKGLTQELPTLAQLNETLRVDTNELQSRKEDVQKALQTSFLRSKVMDVTVLKTDIVNKVVKTIGAIAKIPDWPDDSATVNLIREIVSDHLKAPDVFGDAEKTLFEISPVACLLYPMFFIFYYLLQVLVIKVFMLNWMRGPLSTIMGLLAVFLAALTFDNETANEKAQTVSKLLGMATGALAAAEGILANDGKPENLFQRPEELMVFILHQTIADISEHTVFQPFWYRWTTVQFQSNLDTKKSDLIKLHAVRVFCEVVLSTGLIIDDLRSDIERVNDAAKRMERVLIDPYNYLTLEALKVDVNVSKKYGFTGDHVDSIYPIVRLVSSAHSFRNFLRYLNRVGYADSDDLKRFKTLKDKLSSSIESTGGGGEAGAAAVVALASATIPYGGIVESADSLPKHKKKK